MLGAYFKTALRFLWRQKIYSLINIMGLAIGLACCFFILLYIRQELSFDRQHEKAGRIYRVAQVLKGAAYMGTDHFAATPLPLGAAITQELPEAEYATTFTLSPGTLSRGQDVFSETVAVVDSQFFHVFTVPFLEGETTTALAAPGSVILTRATAKKYFGQENPIGLLLKLDHDKDLTVTAVVEDVPLTAHFSYDLILSQRDATFPHTPGWDFPAFWTYVTLRPGLDADEFQAKLVTIDRKYLAEAAQEPIMESRFFLQPLTDIHLSSHINYEIGPNGDMRTIYMLGTLAVIILLIVGANYVNLATARSARRAREISVRKVIGAGNVHIISCLLSESVLLCFVALMPALALVEFGAPLFSLITGAPLIMGMLHTHGMFAALLAITLLLGLASGYYPALVLSRRQPCQTGTGIHPAGGKNRLRRILVVGQFAMAIVLVIAVLVVREQMSFVQETDLGYQHEQVVAVRASGKAALLKEQLAGLPGVIDVAGGTHAPFDVMRARPITVSGQEIMIYDLSIDEDYLALFDIKIVEGRNFSPDFNEQTNYLINETAARTLGWDNAVGKPLFNGRVVGVVKDFHLHSLQRQIEPLYCRYTSQPWVVMAKISTKDVPATMAAIQKAVKSVIPAQPWQPYFLDEAYNRLYEAEKTVGSIVGVFSVLALLLACLGLLGLAAFSAEQRTKEIGLRKVLGATVGVIWFKLSREYAAWVITANLIAWPIGWFVMRQWLQNFAYHINISWWVFVLAGFAALGLAVLTVSAQAVRAATANPVESLRYE